MKSSLYKLSSHVIGAHVTHIVIMTIIGVVVSSVRGANRLSRYASSYLFKVLLDSILGVWCGFGAPINLLMCIHCTAAVCSALHARHLLSLRRSVLSSVLKLFQRDKDSFSFGWDEALNNFLRHVLCGVVE